MEKVGVRVIKVGTKLDKESFWDERKDNFLMHYITKYSNNPFCFAEISEYYDIPVEECKQRFWALCNSNMNSSAMQKMQFFNQSLERISQLNAKKDDEDLNFLTLEQQQQLQTLTEQNSFNWNIVSSQFMGGKKSALECRALYNIYFVNGNNESSNSVNDNNSSGEDLDPELKQKMIKLLAQGH